MICGKTFSARKGTMFEGLRTEEKTVKRIVTLFWYQWVPLSSHLLCVSS